MPNYITAFLSHIFPKHDFPHAQTLFMPSTLPIVKIHILLDDYVGMNPITSHSQPNLKQWNVVLTLEF